jgi:hypothetical protein
VSKAEAVADDVSLETLTNEPYLEFSLLSIPLSKVESGEPIGMSRGVDLAAYVAKVSSCSGKSMINEICIKSKAIIMMPMGSKSSRMKLL